MSDKIEKIFSFHPATPEKSARMQEVRDKCKELAYIIEYVCTDSREKSLALTKLEEVMFHATSSIARNE